MKRISGFFKRRNSKVGLLTSPTRASKFPKTIPGPTVPNYAEDAKEDCVSDDGERPFIDDRDYEPEDILGPAVPGPLDSAEIEKTNSEEDETLELLFEAAENGWLEELSEAVEQGGDLNSFCNDEYYFGMPALHIAATEGHTAFVKALVEKGADVNLRTQSKGGQTALMVAAMFGQETMIRLLVSLGAHLDSRIKSGPTIGRTALLWAAGSDSSNLGGKPANCVKALLELKASPNARDGKGKTGLMLACRGDIVYAFCEYITFDTNLAEPEPRRGSLNLNTTLGDSMATALHLAAESGNADVAKALVELGADMSARRVHADSKSPLMVAAERGHVGVLRVLCEVPDRHAKLRKLLEKSVKGVVQEEALSPEVARLIADYARPSEAPRILMDETDTKPNESFGANEREVWQALMETPATTFASTQSALQTAKKHTRHAAYRYLRTRLAKMHRVLKKTCGKAVTEWKPNEDSKTIRGEVEAGADTMVGAKAAVNAGNYHALELLFQVGADPRMMGQLLCAAVESKPVGQGLKVIHSARELEVIRTLLEFGVDGNTKDSKGKPVLHLAVQSRRVELVELLAQHAADTADFPGARNENGGSALHLAARQGSPKMCRALILARIRNGSFEGLSGNVETGCKMRNLIGETPIMLAARADNGSTIRAMTAAARDVFGAHYKAEQERERELRELKKRAMQKKMEALIQSQEQILKGFNSGPTDHSGGFSPIGPHGRYDASALTLGGVRLSSRNPEEGFLDLEFDDDMLPGPAPGPTGPRFHDLGFDDDMLPGPAPYPTLKSILKKPTFKITRTKNLNNSGRLSPVQRLNNVFGTASWFQSAIERPQAIEDAVEDDEKATTLSAWTEAEEKNAESGAEMEEREWTEFWAAEISARIGNGKTALHIAAEHRNLNAITALVECGHDTEVDTYASETPLFMVASSTQPYMLVAPSKISQLSFDRSRAQTIGCLLDAMADPNCTANTPAGRWTALAKLAASDHPSAHTIQTLIDRGAQVDLRCRHQGTEERTPLMIAAWKGKLPEVKAFTEVQDRFEQVVGVIKSTRDALDNSAYIAVMIAEYACATESANHLLTDAHGRNAMNARCRPATQKYDARLKKTVFSEPINCREYDTTKPYFLKFEACRLVEKSMLPAWGPERKALRKISAELGVVENLLGWPGKEGFRLTKKRNPLSKRLRRAGFVWPPEDEKDGPNLLDMSVVV